MRKSLIKLPVPVLIRRIAIPASIGFFFNTMYNAVDTWCAGKFVAVEAQAALAAAFPLFFIIIAFCHGGSTGASALVANARGAGNLEEAERLTAQSVMFSVVLSILVGGLGWMYTPHLLHLLEVSGEVLDYGVRYMRLVFLGAGLFIVSSVVNGSIMAVGNTTVFRNAVVGGSLMNVVLDPLFVRGGLGIPAMGFTGIAVATLLIQGCILVYTVHVAFRLGLLKGEPWAYWIPRRREWIELTRQSLPATANMLTIGIGIFIITRFIAPFGSDSVAAYGIATRIEQIALLPSIGLSIAVLSIVGQNFGAGKIDRIRETLRVALRSGAVAMALGGVLLVIAGRPMMELFAPEGNDSVVWTGVEYLIYAAPVLFAYVILFVWTSALQGMKHPLYAIVIGFVRQIAAPLLLFPLFLQWSDGNLYGLWVGVMIVNWSAALFTWWYGHRTLSLYLPPQPSVKAA